LVVTDFQERFLADIGKYETREATRVIGQHLHSLLGPDPVEDSQILAYLLRPDDDMFRALVVTPQRFVVFEMLPSSAYMIATLPLDRVSRVYEFGTPETLTVTIEMDADITTISSSGNFAHALDIINPAENPVTRGDFVAEATTKPASYSTFYQRSDTDNVAKLLEFSVAFRAAMGA
jgi:hypothetical protein